MKELLKKSKALEEVSGEFQYKMVKFVSLFSGSDKNSSVFSYKSTNIMVDCGGSLKAISGQLKEIDMSIGEIDALFITHSHSDHIASLSMIIKNTDIPIYASYGTHEEIFDMGINMPKDRRIIIYDNMPFEIDNIIAESFKTPHDTKYSLGYNFYFREKTSTFATDIGHIDLTLEQNFKGRDFLFLESNHDVEMLKNSPRPYSVKNRILGLNGHLSNEVSSEVSEKLVKKGLKRLMLGHLSGDANTPELAYNVTKNRFIQAGIKVDDDISLNIAPRGMLSKVIEF